LGVSRNTPALGAVSAGQGTIAGVVAARAGEVRQAAAARAKNRAREGLEAIMSEILPAVSRSCLIV
jgi:hypothetical protein